MSYRVYKANEVHFESGIIREDNLIRLGNTICVGLNYNSPTIGFAEIIKETEKAVYLHNESQKAYAWIPKSALVYILIDKKYQCGFWTLNAFFRKKLVIDNNRAFKVFYSW